MEEKGVQPDRVTHNTLMSLHLKRGDPLEVSKELARMKKAGLTPDIYTYTALLKAEVEYRTGDVDGVLRAMAVMCEEGILPDAHVYHTLAQAHAANAESKTDCKEAIVPLLNSMKDVGVQLSVHLCCTLLSTCAKHNDLRTGNFVLKHMRNAKVVHNVLTYSALIHLYASVGEEQLALASLSEMKSLGLEPNVVTFTALLHLYIKLRDADGALSVLAQMQEAGVDPNEQTYTTMVTVCLTCRYFDMADIVLNTMVQQKEKAKLPQSLLNRTLAQIEDARVNDISITLDGFAI
jgi:pentatricopeptide repeat domain-containing protein 1